MRRGSRVALVTAFVTSGALFVGLLVAFSTASEGPLGAALDRIGTSIGTIEHTLKERVSGPGRRGDLAWLDAYRTDVNRLRRPDRVLLGAFDLRLSESLEGVVQLEKALGTTLPLLQIYSAWGDKPDQRFPLRQVTAFWDAGSIPVITWEPWLTDFENGRHPELPLREMRDRHGLASVARGDYDFYVDAWAAEAARWGKPFFMRFGHEMNDPYRYPWGPQNDTKEEFIAAWRHVVERFRAAGATNVLWVWSPHVAYKYWETYFPGPDVVDWVATGALNFGTVAHWSQWWTFHDLFGMKYPDLAVFAKPIMIAEFGSLKVGGDRESWYRDALSDLPQTAPLVKAVLFFNVTSDQTVTYQQVDWSITDDGAVTKAVAAAIHDWRGHVTTH